MGVGKSINFMNISNFSMNKFIKAISTVMVTFALLVSAFNAPIVSVAYAQSDSGFSFDIPGFTLPTFDFGLNTGTGNNLGGSSSFTMQTCELTTSQTQIQNGGNVTLTWNTSGFQVFTLNGQTLQTNNGSLQMTNILQNTTYELIAKTADGASNCVSKVTITCLPPPTPVDCRLEVTKVVDKSTALVGDNLVYTITVKNIGSSDCTGDGVKIEDIVNGNLSYLTQSVTGNLTAGYGTQSVYTAGDRTLRFNGGTLTPGEYGIITWVGKVISPSSCGNFEIPNQAKATAKELNNFGTWVYSQTVKTAISNGCQSDPAPTCDAFTVNPGSIIPGASSVLSWQTSNATQVTMNNGIGNVAADGSVTVSPTTNTTYVLTVYGTQNRSVNCSVPVTVSQDPAPSCDSFTATPSTIVAGQSAVLAWQTSNGTVSINNGIGNVAVDGSMTVTPLASTVYRLTVFGTQNRSVNCEVPVTVTTVEQNLTCQNNVSFTASDYSIRRGDVTNLNWNTNNVDSVSISVINATTLSGSKTIEPTSDTTYVLTARKGSKSVDCPITVSIESGGGGGGGSSSPKCELTISDNKIRSGEQVTLKWDTSRATEVTIKDNNGKTLMSTDKYNSKDKKEHYDGSIKLKPTRDTEYTLVAERGSKERTCKVKVNVDDIKVITDRKPLVSGISLTTVPYTGFEAGPMLTILFYTLLIAWAFFITYLIVMRRRQTASHAVVTEMLSPSVLSMKQAEGVRPDVFTASVTPMTMPVTIPNNLPTGAPVIGYANVVEVRNPVNPHHVTDEVVTTLENRAHDQMALLSSDAIRHFISTTAGTLERNQALDTVIAQAKHTYPLEDGWIVINEARMQNLCEVCMVNNVASQNAPFVPAIVPTGSSSLAEAIVTGNIIAAYEMIGNRPMFALADAASDLDAVVRSRRGEVVHISNLLKTETTKLSDDKLKNMITALTGALDGTYTDEASAVKVAIMKAVKEVA